jgi:hypothetical protein
MQQLNLFAQEHRANPSQSPDYEKDWMTLVATLPSFSLASFNAIAPDGWYGRTCPVSCQIKPERLEPSSEGWANSGMGSPTEFWTLSTLEFPNAAAASSLSDVLEAGKVPQRYFLSATACKGILLRAEKRGKKLPAQLKSALELVATPIQATETEAE